MLPRDFDRVEKYLADWPPTVIVIRYITTITRISTPVRARESRSMAINTKVTVRMELNTWGIVWDSICRMESVSFVNRLIVSP